MNEKSKARLRKMNDLMVSKLEEAFEIKVYQDSVSEDEEQGYTYFIFETGGITKANPGSLYQDVLLRFMSENKDDLDEMSLDIIQILEDIKYNFKSTTKYGIQKGETDSYIDVIEFNLTRTIKYGI